MKQATLFLILSLSLPSAAFATTLAEQAAKCRELIGSARPQGGDDERSTRYFEEAERAYRDCRGTAMPLDIRANALLMYGMASDVRGRNQTAIAAYEEGIALLDGAKGERAAVLIQLLDQASFAESRAGLQDAATTHAQRALDERVKKWGANDSETSTGLVNLAMVHATFGDYESGEKLLRKAVAVAEKACGPECDALAMAYSGMRTLYGLMGKPAEAQKYDELAQNAIPPNRPGRD